jgi:phosphatidylglycerol:prolipoprotein diacylglycerol transferase
MIPYVCHIYGDLYFNCYGLFIALALVIFVSLAQRDTLRKNFLSAEQLTSLIFFGIITIFIGARILYVATNYECFDSWLSMLAIWRGGFSLLGGIISAAITIPFYLAYHKVPVLPIGDLICTYAPLAMGISRIGCFCAGCCYGIPTTCLLGVTYTHPHSMAPLHQHIHPTQLYNALSLIIIFVIIRFILRRYLHRP